jgi:transmembrane sensor
MDASSRQQFDVWMQSHDNAQELARICLIDALLQKGLVKNEPQPALPENVINFHSYAPSPRPRAHQVTVAPVASRVTRRITMAAGLAVMALVVTFASVVSTDQVIVTREGRWDKQLLEDGTVVYAGPRTQLKFHFDEQTRAVTLLRGEALFEVAKEPGRPFVVTTETGTVQALGTVFATADVGDKVVVTVASGRVAATAVGGVQPMVALGVNRQAVMSSGGVSQPVEVNAERETKWIRNWYEYDGEQVGDIIAQLNQRHEVKVVVDDPQVLRLRLTSLSFKPSEPKQFVIAVNHWYADYPRKTSARGVAVHLQRP